MTGLSSRGNRADCCGQASAQTVSTGWSRNVDGDGSQAAQLVDAVNSEVLRRTRHPNNKAVAHRLRLFHLLPSRGSSPLSDMGGGSSFLSMSANDLITSGPGSIKLAPKKH